MNEQSPTRRNVIKTLASAGAVGAANQLLGRAAIAQTSPTTNPSTQSAKAASAPSTTQLANAITESDAAGADKVAGRDYTDAERAMMLPDLETYRRRYRRFRQVKIDPTVEPAVHFDPRFRDTVLPKGP